jgi:hypothetical protein
VFFFISGKHLILSGVVAFCLPRRVGALGLAALLPSATWPVLLPYIKVDGSGSSAAGTCLPAALAVHVGTSRRKAKPVLTRGLRSSLQTIFVSAFQHYYGLAFSTSKSWMVLKVRS